MNNPWLNLPTRQPYVLKMDQAVVEAYNQRLDETSRAILQTQLLPEPFIGKPAAPIYILSLNPGFSVHDHQWHQNKKFRAASQANLKHQTDGFLFLDPRFNDCPGSIWWRKRLRWLIEQTSQDQVYRSLFCVELSPYHSKRFKSVPKSISKTGLVPSVEYSAYLVRTAIKQRKPIIAMRSWRKWCKLVPELEDYNKVFRLNSPQNVSVSPGNVNRFDELVQLVERTN